MAQDELEGLGKPKPPVGSREEFQSLLGQRAALVIALTELDRQIALHPANPVDISAVVAAIPKTLPKGYAKGKPESD